MTPRDLRNIHITAISCRDTLPCANMALPWYFYFLMEKPLHRYFQIQSPYYQVAQCNQKTPIPVCSWWSNIKVRFSFNQPNRKEWGARLVDAVKHLPHKGAFTYYVITEGRGGERSLNCLCMIIRPSQIVCTVMTKHVTCTQTALHVHGIDSSV